MPSKPAQTVLTGIQGSFGVFALVQLYRAGQRAAVEPCPALRIAEPTLAVPAYRKWINPVLAGLHSRRQAAFVVV